MPIYEYRCNECEKNFEYLVLGSKEPENCQLCDGSKIQRIMSTCGFISRSYNPGGTTTKTSASASGCTGCAATSCSTCGN